MLLETNMMINKNHNVQTHIIDVKGHGISLLTLAWSKYNPMELMGVDRFSFIEKTLMDTLNICKTFLFEWMLRLGCVHFS